MPALANPGQGGVGGDGAGGGAGAEAGAGQVARAGALAPAPGPGPATPRSAAGVGGAHVHGAACASGTCGGGGGDPLISIYCYRIEDTALRDRFECQFDLSLPVSANAAIIADKLYSRPSATAASGTEVDGVLGSGEGPTGASVAQGPGQAVGSTTTPSTLASTTAAPSPDASEMDNSPGQGPGPGHGSQRSAGGRSGEGADGGVVRTAGTGGSASGSGGGPANATALAVLPLSDSASVAHRFPDAVLYRLAPTGMSEECDESMKRSIKAHSTFIISPDGDASLYAIPDLGGECDCELKKTDRSPLSSHTPPSTPHITCNPRTHLYWYGGRGGGGGGVGGGGGLLCV
jgi:hypothetical protein